jgi:hypothetical protein
MACLLAPRAADAQRGGRGAPPTGREGAALDLTGYWVSVVAEDWKLRMVTPAKGVFDMLPLNAEGRRVGEAWDAARDAAAGESCRAYGAGNIMRVPGRLHITWADDNTLRIDTDAGSQTRLLRFGAASPRDEAPTWQGQSRAQWAYAPGRRGGGAPRPGSLTVVTTSLRSGYVRGNGAPYSAQAVVTEYFDLNTFPNADQWLTVTTRVEDPVYFSRPYLTSSDFKKLPDNSGWTPTPCSAG